MEHLTVLLLDLVLLGVLVYCFVMGLRRGFVLTLCSLLAVLLALLGGWYLATHWSQPLADTLEPAIVQTLTDEAGEETSGDPALPEGLPASLTDQITQAAENVQSAALTQTAALLAGLAAKAILFLVGFVAVLVVWNLLCRGLDLVARLPVLHGLNKVLGGALGLVKGIVILLIVRWVLCSLLGWIPADIAQESILLSWLGSLDLGALLNRQS